MQPHSVFQIGKLTVDLGARTALTDGRRLYLTRKELAVLELLLLHRGWTVTKDMFLNYLYASTDYEPDPKIIDVYVCKLRRKIAEETGDNDYIETIWGRGYRLRGEEVLTSATASLAS